MPEKKGRLVNVNVDINDPSVGGSSANWQRIASVTSISRSLTGKITESTTNDEEGWEKSVAVGKAGSFSVESNLNPEDPVYQFLQRKVQTEESVAVQLDATRINGTRDEVLCLVESIEDEFPGGDKATSSISFKWIGRPVVSGG